MLNTQDELCRSIFGSYLKQRIVTFLASEPNLKLNGCKELREKNNSNFGSTHQLDFW